MALELSGPDPELLARLEASLQTKEKAKIDNKIVITPADLKDVVTHGMKLTHGKKMALFREAGKRQAAGEVGSDFSAVPISDLILEALADNLGFTIEKLPVEPIPDSKVIAFLQRLPKKARAAIEKESERRIQMGAANSSMNAIILESIDKKFNI